MTLTASTVGQSPEYLELVARVVHESLEDRALREAAEELAARGPRYALSVLEDHVRREL